MYENPGYNVFDWRSQEGGFGTKQGLRDLNQHHDQWKQQQDMADALRRKQELDEARRRAGQYADATNGIGNSTSGYQQYDQPQMTGTDLYRQLDDFGSGVDTGSISAMPDVPTY